MTGSKLHVRRQQVGIRLRERTTPLPLHMIHSDGHQSRISYGGAGWWAWDFEQCSQSLTARKSIQGCVIPDIVDQNAPSLIGSRYLRNASRIAFTSLATNMDSCAPGSMNESGDSRYFCMLPGWSSSPEDGNDKSGISKPKPDAGVVPWAFSSPASGNRFTEGAGVAVSARSSV